MPINPNIAMGFQAPQIESPMNMMAQMMQMKSAQEGGQLNALKLQQAQREVEQQNMLGQAYQSAFDPQTGKVDYSKLTSQLAGAGAGAQIPGILKGQRELESADVDAKTKKVKLLTDTLSTVPEMYKMASTPDDFLAVHQYVHSDPVLGPWLKSIGATPEKGLATLQAASQTPEGLSQYKNQAMSSVNQILESSKPLVVAPSASVFAGGKFLQAPSAPSGPIKPPEKLEIMRALGYSMDAVGDAAYEAAKRAPPTVAVPPVEIASMRALGIPETPEGYAYFQALKAKDSKPTDLQSNYEYAKKQGFKGDIFAYEKALKEAGRAPGTTVTMVSERAEQGARGKMLVDQYGDIAKAAGLAARTLPSIEVNLSALNKGFDTGFGKETIAAGASVLASLGVKDAEKFATDAQKFQSNAISAVLQKQLEQKGPQTESDARRIEQIGAQLGKTKQANEFILSMAGEQLRRDIDQRNFYDRWYKTNKTYDGAEDAWFNGEGGKSLFDRPGLKKYAVTGSEPNSAVQSKDAKRPSLGSIFGGSPQGGK
jgi:hypothetical protein